MSINALDPDRTIFVAMRARDNLGMESEISPVAGWTPPAAPFIQGISVNPGNSCGEYDFKIVGIGLDTATEIVFQSSEPVSFTTTSFASKLGTIFGVVNLSGPGASGLLSVTVTTPTGSDELSGWVRLGPTSSVDCAEPSLSPSCINMQRSGATWHFTVCGEVQTMAPSNQAGDPVIEIFDVLGRRVSSHPMARVGSGWEADWSGRTSSGSPAPTGIFFARIRNGDQSFTKKIFHRN